MSLKNLNTVLATACVLFTLYLGASFILPLESVFPGWNRDDRVGGRHTRRLFKRGRREAPLGTLQRPRRGRRSGCGRWRRRGRGLCHRPGW